MRRIAGRDLAARLAALALGAGVGLRALYVAAGFYRQGGYASMSGGGTIWGLIVTVAFVAGVALWSMNRESGRRLGQLLVAFDAGMMVGALAGTALFAGG